MFLELATVGKDSATGVTSAASLGITMRFEMVGEVVLATESLLTVRTLMLLC